MREMLPPTPPVHIVERTSGPGATVPPARAAYVDTAWQQADSPTTVSIREYLAVLYRRRWLAAAVFILVVAVAVVRNLMAVSIYQASARVLVNPERLNLVKFEDVVSQQRSVDTELAILRSRWLAKETVTALGLIPRESRELANDVAAGSNTPAATGTASASGTADAPAMSSASVVVPPPTIAEPLVPPPAAPPAPRAPVDSLDQWRDWWTGAKNVMWRIVGPAPLDAPAPERDSLAGESAAEAREIDTFLSGLGVSLTPDGVLDISYRSIDPAQAARYANAHAQTYIKQNVETRFEAVQEATDWLRDRLDEQKRKLDASEHAVLAFQEEHGLVGNTEGPSVTSTFVAARLNELSASITRAETTRLEKEAEYERAMALRANPDELDRLPQMQASAPLQQLRLDLDRQEQQRAQLSKSLRDAHPDMVKLREAIETTHRKLDVERSRVLEALRQDVAAAKATEGGLTGELDKLKREAAEQNRGNVQLDILKREADSNRQIYDVLTQRARETGVAREPAPNRTRVLDPALVPTSPFSPNKTRNLMQGVLWGMALAIGLALGLERLDNRIKLPTEIGKRLGLPLIGLIPEVQIATGRRIPLALDDVVPEFAEELRRIRTNLLFSLPGDKLRTIGVTSSGPSEGKTVVASNIAVTLAQAGQRVLLIDADLRRPTVHLGFSIPQEPGLSNILVGTVKANEAIRRTAQTGLCVLPAGRRPPNPSELLGSHQFSKFLTNLVEHFDWVIIDGPPVVPVTDACVLAHFVSGMLFVVGAERTSHQVARRAVTQLTHAGATVLGGILNRVEIKRHAYYYGAYYDAYDRKYAKYYDEPPSVSA